MPGQPGGAKVAFARRAGVCLLAGLAFTGRGAAQASPVEARILEVGRAGRLHVGFPARVRVEVATRERLEGVLEVSLAFPPTAPPSREGSHVVRTRFVLEAGERRSVTAYLPDVPSFGDRSPDLEVRWRVVGASLQAVAEGLVTAHVEPTTGPWSSLLITDAVATEPWRSPRDAFDEALPYAEFADALVSGRDFDGLTPSQQRALLDWTALGGVLVVTAPFPPRGFAALGEAARRQTVVWRDEAGRQARETPEHLGFVRTVDLPLTELALPGSPARAALARLLRSRGALQPGGQGTFNALPPLERERRLSWLQQEAERGPHEPRRAVGLASVVGLLFLLFVLGGVAWTSGPSARTPTWMLLAGVIVVIASPGLVYSVLSRVRTGNVDRCWDLTYQDGISPLQSRWTRAAIGGGGGSVGPELEFSTGPRVIWSIESDLSPGHGLRADQEPTGLLRVGVDDLGLTPDRQLAATRGELGPAEPAWDADELQLDEAIPRGELRSRRAFDQVAVFGPLGLARFGSVRPGDKLDLASAAWSRWVRIAPRGTEYYEEVLSSMCAAQVSLDGCRVPTYFAVGREAAPPTVRAASGSDAWPATSIHVQRLRPGTGQEGRLDLAAGYPAERTGNVLSLHVPEALWAAMRDHDIRLRYGFGVYPEPNAPVKVSAPSAGFRTVSFRVTGAPSPLASRYGPGMVECVWSRR